MKKGLIIGGSIAAVVLLAGGITLGVVLGTKKEVFVPATETVSANDFGIGAFSTVDSFDKDGYNSNIRAAAKNYTNEYNGNSDYKTSSDRVNVQEITTPMFSVKGEDYVQPILDSFKTNDIIISAGFPVADALWGVDSSDPSSRYDGIFSNEDGSDTSIALSDVNMLDERKSFILMDDDPNTKQIGQLYKNAVSVDYSAEQAGFLAGKIATIYSILYG